MKNTYKEVLGFLFRLHTIYRIEGPKPLESSIEAPLASDFFNKYGKSVVDKPEALTFLTDSLLAFFTWDFAQGRFQRLLELDLASNSDPLIKVIKEVLLAMHTGEPPFIASEFGRRSIPLKDRPTFAEMDELLSAIGRDVNFELFGEPPTLAPLEISRAKEKYSKMASSDPMAQLSVQEASKVLNVLQKISNETLIKSLVGADSDLIGLIFLALSGRAKEMLWVDVNMARKTGVSEEQRLEAIEEVKKILNG